MEATIISAALLMEVPGDFSSMTWGIVSKPAMKNGAVIRAARIPGQTDPIWSRWKNGSRFPVSPKAIPANMKTAQDTMKTAVMTS